MFKQLIRRNLWSENVATVQLLGLCPLLAVSHAIEPAAGLAAASCLVLVGSAALVSLLRHWIPTVVRLPMFVLVIATYTTIAVMLMQAFAWELYMQIALFMQIIVTNCMILGRINQVASRENFGVSVLDAVTTSIAFAIILIGMGAIRELAAIAMPLAAHPTGAFLIFGLLIAAFQGVRRESSPAERLAPVVVREEA
ncbi:MAG: electron transport complex subunit RsxE [Gammaproteobacteria bacterium]|nr:electron transport complex subunit RsxE [Gammaproteobacteria bacterium]